VLGVGWPGANRRIPIGEDVSTGPGSRPTALSRREPGLAYAVVSTCLRRDYLCLNAIVEVAPPKPTRPPEGMGSMRLTDRASVLRVIVGR
jgi:hypothetical protein